MIARVNLLRTRHKVSERIVRQRPRWLWLFWRWRLRRYERRAMPTNEPVSVTYLADFDVWTGMWQP